MFELASELVKNLSVLVNLNAVRLLVEKLRLRMPLAILKGKGLKIFEVRVAFIKALVQTVTGMKFGIGCNIIDLEFSTCSKFNPNSSLIYVLVTSGTERCLNFTSWFIIEIVFGTTFGS